jgi:predicted acyl esterase
MILKKKESPDMQNYSFLIRFYVAPRCIIFIYIVLVNNHSQNGLNKMAANGLILLSISLLIISCAPALQDETLMVPMRDGVKLSTQILFPQVKQKQYPVVLLRTPYKKERRVEQYSYLVENGYVLVLQDVRGRFGSEGIFEPFVNEGKDGYDAIEWIAQQAWCDGNIGMIGSS